jgi:hypothetical protein
MRWQSLWRLWHLEAAFAFASAFCTQHESFLQALSVPPAACAALCRTNHVSTLWHSRSPVHTCNEATRCQSGIIGEVLRLSNAVGTPVLFWQEFRTWPQLGWQRRIHAGALTAKVVHACKRGFLVHIWHQNRQVCRRCTCIATTCSVVLMSNTHFSA